LSPSSQGDKVSLQLRGDIILEHLHNANLLLTPWPPAWDGTETDVS
jgi:hypothetical protein